MIVVELIENYPSLDLRRVSCIEVPRKRCRPSSIDPRVVKLPLTVGGKFAATRQATGTHRTDHDLRSLDQHNVVRMLER
jgi:hypothetical protein